MIAATLRIWTTLMLRDIRTRRGQSRFGFLLNLLEPVGQLALVYIVFAALQRKADYGTDLFVFLISGLVPYFAFVHCTGRIQSAPRLAQPLRVLGVVNAVDVAIATMLLETLTITVASAALFAGCWALGLAGAVPRAPVSLILSMLSVSATAFGAGLCNACLIHFFAAYRLIWMLVARSLLFFSSVFYVLENLSPDLRSVLLWNPLLHSVIWFRVGVFGPSYPNQSLSCTYLGSFAALSIMLGLAMERILRRRG